MDYDQVYDQVIQASKRSRNIKAFKPLATEPNKQHDIWGPSFGLLNTSELDLPDDVEDGGNRRPSSKRAKKDGKKELMSVDTPRPQVAKIVQDTDVVKEEDDYDEAASTSVVVVKRREIDRAKLKRMRLTRSRWCGLFLLRNFYRKYS